MKQNVMCKSRQPGPADLKKLRACLQCSLIKTVDLFRADGCDNCDPEEDEDDEDVPDDEGEFLRGASLDFILENTTDRFMGYVFFPSSYITLYTFRMVALMPPTMSSSASDNNADSADGGNRNAAANTATDGVKDMVDPGSWVAQCIRRQHRRRKVGGIYALQILPSNEQ